MSNLPHGLGEPATDRQSAKTLAVRDVVASLTALTYPEGAEVLGYVIASLLKELEAQKGNVPVFLGSLALATEISRAQSR